MDGCLLVVALLGGLTLLSEEDDGRGGAEGVGHLAAVGAEVVLGDVLDDESAPYHGAVGAQLLLRGVAGALPGVDYSPLKLEKAAVLEGA